MEKIVFKVCITYKDKDYISDSMELEEDVFETAKTAIGETISKGGRLCITCQNQTIYFGSDVLKNSIVTITIL